FVARGCPAQGAGCLRAMARESGTSLAQFQENSSHAPGLLRPYRAWLARRGDPGRRRHDLVLDRVARRIRQAGCPVAQAGLTEGKSGSDPDFLFLGPEVLRSLGVLLGQALHLLVHRARRELLVLELLQLRLDHLVADPAEAGVFLRRELDRLGAAFDQELLADGVERV